MTMHRGKLPSPVTIFEVRPLTREDLEMIREKRTTPIVEKFRDPHHHVARLIAAGLRLDEVAERSGYSYARIATLSADPTFQQLIAEKRKDVDRAFIESQDDYYRLASSNMLKAERQLSERLDKADEDNELLPVRDLISISRDAADRFGYGKKTTNVNLNVDFAARLEAAAARSTKVIEGRNTAQPLDDVEVVSSTPSLRRRA